MTQASSANLTPQEHLTQTKLANQWVLASNNKGKLAEF